jgi:hypothetical protein
MKVNSTYGMKNSPAIDTVTGKTTRCHYCNSDEDKPTQFMNKGDKCIRLIFNAGPVGIAYVCMKHARQMSKELIQLLEGSE